MDGENPALLALVRAVCEGASVDWDSAGAGASDSFKGVLAELRAVAQLADLNRSLGGETGREPPVSAPLRSRAPGRSLARWGHLHLLEHVASGTFGDVYRGWDPAIDREVALKLLRPQPGGDTDADENIEEGRLLARVRHPNVVTVYGAARIEGRVGIWMEFVQGRTLAAVIRQDGPLSAQEVIALGVTLCDAVATVHDAGLLHRDIKAQNVMLATDRRVVLMDFGAGRPVDQRTREVAGTPLYLAPEIAAGQQATPRSDVYSLGVLLYLLATGTFPGGFRPKAGAPPQGAIGSREFRAVSIEPKLERIVARAIVRDPDARFESARDLGAALRDCAAPIRIRRSPIAFVLVAVGLTAAVTATIPLARGLAGAPATPVASAAGPASGEEALRKLPWRVMPTGPPSLDGRFMGGVDWNTPTGTGLPVLIDLGTDAVRTLMEPPKGEAEAGSYSDSSSIAPDATRIAFSWSVPAPKAVTELRVTALDGSALRTVYRDPGPGFRVVGWSANADEVLVLRDVASRQSELAWVAMTDGRERVVLHLPFVPSVSLHQNGRDLLLDWPQPDGLDKRDLRVADMLTGTLRPLLTAPANDAMPMWLPDGHHVLFASDRAGTFGAWLTDAEGTEPRQVHGSMGAWQPLGFGAHGELSYRALTGTVDVYTARVDLVSRTIGPRQLVATSFQGRNLFSDWAPDNRHLAFTSRRGLAPISWDGHYVVVRDVESTHEQVLPNSLGDIGPPRWSPDGRRLALMGDGSPNPAVLVLDARSGRTELACRQSGVIRNVEWRSNDRIWLIDDAAGSRLRGVSLPSCVVTDVAADVGAFSISRARDRVAMLSMGPNGITLAVAGVGALAEGHEVFHSPGPGRLELAGWTPDDAFIVAIGSVRAPGQAHPGPLQLFALPSQGGGPIVLSLAGVGEPPHHVRLRPDGSLLSFEAGSPGLTTWVLTHPLFHR